MELDPIYIDNLKRYKKLYPESEFKCLNGIMISKKVICRNLKVIKKDGRNKPNKIFA